MVNMYTSGVNFRLGPDARTTRDTSPASHSHFIVRSV